MIITENIDEDLSDEEVVNLVLEDANCFAVVISRYKVKLFNYIRRITNIREEDVEDLLQEIFLKVYLNINSFDQTMKFSSWIYAIARNQTISHFRKIKVRPEGYLEVIDDEMANRLKMDFDLIDHIDKKEQQARIAKALFKLKSKYRELIILKFIEEKSYQEISDIIKKPTGTVGSMLNKAKEDLRKILSQK
ncbi:MAG TPA: RNA polymerase sigma factor [bacterium]|nr:RNA polymerase sigma factor [bacterium]